MGTRNDRGAVPFLTAGWHDIIMLTFEVDAEILTPFVPPGLVLDLWQGRAFVTLVGLVFDMERLKGVRLPFLPRFPQVNLRFYVSSPQDDGAGRGVVFIKEIMPRPLMALTARWLFRQNYVVRPMKHSLLSSFGSNNEERLEYKWRARRHWEQMGVMSRATWSLPGSGSREEFVVERYAGYVRDGLKTRMFKVSHPPWRIRPAQDAWLKSDVGAVFGKQFVPYLQAAPAFAFMAEGGRTELYWSSVLEK